MSAGTDIVPTTDADALAADPVGYMQVVLHRARGWLAEARDIDAVRETKAVAIGYESVIREKELAFDAQLTATEIVRRCERRMGELVREGQAAGRISQRGQTHLLGVEDDRRSVPDLLGPGGQTVADTQAMGDATSEAFEAAISASREEGNLSRRNVVSKVKPGNGTTRPRRPVTGENGRFASGRSIQRIAAQASALAMTLDALPLTKSCARLTDAERTEALQSCRRGLKALNALANALGR